MPALSVTSGLANELLCEWEAKLLRPKSEALALQQKLGLVAPYTDPSLVRSKRKYARFIQRLFEAGMIRYATEGEVTVGVFFVKKTSGKIRIILDTRIVNTEFKTPESTRLPSAGSFASLETPNGFSLHHGDVCDAFYHVGLPESLIAKFGLPKLTASELGL